MAFTKVNSLVRGLMILESFKSGSFRLTLSEISRITLTPKATVFRLLKTLTEMNYLKYDSRHKEYYLGPKVLSLGYSVLQSIEVREIIKPYLEKLSVECNKTVNFAVRDETDMVYVERVRVPGSIETYRTVGSRIPVYGTSVGRATMAHLPEVEIEGILAKLKSDPEARPFIQDKDKLFRILEEVRRSGYATHDGEYAEDISALAVPIFGPEGVIGAINLVVARGLISMDKFIEKYAPLMIETGQEISDALGDFTVKERRTR